MSQALLLLLLLLGTGSAIATEFLCGDDDGGIAGAAGDTGGDTTQFTT